MLLTKIEKQILKSANSISISNLQSDFDSEMIFLKDTFLRIAKIQEYSEIEKYLIKRFSELEINKAKKKVDLIEEFKSKIYSFKVDNVFKKQYLSLKFLFNILLEKELIIKNIDKKELFSYKMEDDIHFNLVYLMINKTIQEENLTQQTNHSFKTQTENLDDLLDDDQDNFFYSYDADDVDDTYDGADFDNYD